MKNKKKILIVTEFFYPEEFKVNDVALAWRDKGYDVDVLTLVPSYPSGTIPQGQKNSFFRKDKYNGINIYRLRTITGYKDSVIKKVVKYLNFMIFGSIVAAFIGRKYNYIFGFNAGALPCMMPVVVIRKLYKKPTMLWVQDVWPESVYAYGFKKNKLLERSLDLFVKFMHSNITAIAISSKGFKSKLTPYVNKGTEFTYAPNWADELNMDMESVALSTKSKVHFTFAGNIGKVQNLENIIDAFCSLSNKNQENSQLNIIGDGSNLNNLKQLSCKNPNIVFHGKKERKNMARYYKSSDFLIVSLIDKPIFSVTVPAKIQTYIAAKKPILGFINGETANIIRKNNLGLCANPENIIAIAKVFEKCIGMSKEDKAMHTMNCKKLLQTTFNKDRVIKRLEKTLLEK